MKRLFPILLILLSVSSISACYGKTDILADGTFTCRIDADCLADDNFKCVKKDPSDKTGVCKEQDPQSANSCTPYDTDNDGYPAKNTPKNILPSCAQCIAGNTDVCTGKKLDCDDHNSQRNPGNKEVCDGIDNDCDGTTDNKINFPCSSNSECDAISMIPDAKLSSKISTKNGANRIGAYCVSGQCKPFLEISGKCYPMNCSSGEYKKEGTSVDCNDTF